MTKTLHWALLTTTAAMQGKKAMALANNDIDKTALLMIDVQNCFCEEGVTSSGEPGSLAVADTASLIPVLNELREQKSCLFDHVVRSQDFHPENHISFGPTHGLEPFAHLSEKGELPLMCIAPESGLMTDASCCPTFHVDPSLVDCETQLCPTTATDAVLSAPACQICQESPEDCFETTQAMWTNHCLQDGDSDFPATLVTMDSDIVVEKGTGSHVDAYSAFSDNTKRLESGLDDTLMGLGVKTLYVTGIATDFCVYHSVLDALERGYRVKVIEDATRGIAQDSIDAALQDMASKGAEIVTVADVLDSTTCSEHYDFESSSVFHGRGFLHAIAVLFGAAALVMV